MNRVKEVWKKGSRRRRRRRRWSKRADWAVLVLYASGELLHTSINNTPQISRLERESGLLEA